MRATAKNVMKSGARATAKSNRGKYIERVVGIIVYWKLVHDHTVVRGFPDIALLGLGVA